MLCTQTSKTWIIIAAVATVARGGTLAATTVDDLLAQARSGNPQLQMLDAEIAAARGERTQAGAWRNPELTGSMGRKDARDSENALQGAGIEFAVSLSQTFDFPGKATLRKAIADRNVELAGIVRDMFVRSMAARIRGLAADLLACESQVRAAAQVIGEADLIAKMLRERPGGGPQAAIEARLIEATLVEIRRSVLEIGTHASGLRSEINQLRGQPAIANLELTGGGKPTQPPRPLQHLLLSIGEGTPRIRVRALELQRAALALSAARLGAAPDITIAPYYAWQQAGDLETSAGASLSFSLPVWDQGKGNIAAARAREDQAQAGILLAKRELEVEVTRRHRAWEQAGKILQEVNEAKIAEFREAAELAARQFRTGAIPIQLYLDMQREYLASTRTYHDALATMAGEAAEIEQLTSAAPAPGQSGTTD